MILFIRSLLSRIRIALKWGVATLNYSQIETLSLHFIITYYFRPEEFFKGTRISKIIRLLPYFCPNLLDIWDEIR